RSMADALSGAKPAPGWSSLVAIRAGGPLPPFYCIHAVDGWITYYQALADQLGPDQPVYGLQAVGLDGKQPPHPRIEEMAAHYVGEVRSHQREGPYYLGGGPGGGSIAYETAQR